MNLLFFLLLTLLSISTYGKCLSKKPPSITFCETTSFPATCPKSNNPVCAITDDNCYDSNTCAHTVQNACTACSDPAINSYITGKCFDLTKPTKLTCDPNHRPNTCGTRTELVCAIYNDGSTRTILSPCYACRDSRVKHYTPGICPKDSDKTFCDIENFPRPCPPPPEWLYQPACAYIRDCTEEPCRYTATYQCPICGSNNVDYYTEGECKTSCDSKTLAEICSENTLGPVCAYKRDCTGDDCGMTMENGCAACGDPSVGAFSDRECYQPPELPEDVAP